MKVRFKGEVYEASWTYSTRRVPIIKTITRERSLQELVDLHDASAARRIDTSKLPKPWDEETDERRKDMTRDDSPLWYEVTYETVGYENIQVGFPMVWIVTDKWCIRLGKDDVEILDET